MSGCIEDLKCKDCLFNVITKGCPLKDEKHNKHLYLLKDGTDNYYCALDKQQLLEAYAEQEGYASVQAVDVDYEYSVVPDQKLMTFVIQGETYTLAAKQWAGTYPAGTLIASL